MFQHNSSPHFGSLSSFECRYPNSIPFQRYVPYFSYPELRLNNDLRKTFGRWFQGMSVVENEESKMAA